MNQDTYTIDTGMLDVGNGHKIAYQRWGNPEAKPIFVLHGGPGSKSKDKHKLSFNPNKQQVVFHDQRGCGQSTPYGSLKHNTTQDLVGDIERLRTHFNFDDIQLFGGSWGSALALAYAVEYPEKVSKMLLNGIYTGTRKENDYIQQGGLATHYPDSYEDYLTLVPKDQREETTNYYFKKMQDEDEQIANQHAAAFSRNEAAAMSLDSNYELTKLSINPNELTAEDRASMLIEPHYFTNDCFMADNYILDNAAKLRGIPIVFVHGRYDHVCPPITAYNLSKAIGENCHLQIVPSNHGFEGAMREAINAYVFAFLD